MSTKSILTAIVAFLSLQLNAQQTLYKIDWDDQSTFRNSCGLMEAGAWRVSGDSCEYTSSAFVISEIAGGAIDIDLRAMVDGKLTAQEKIYGNYYVNDALVKSFSANGSQFVGDYKRMDRVEVKNGQHVVIKIALVSTSNDRGWIISSDDIKVIASKTEAKQVATFYNGRITKVIWNYETGKDCNYFIVERSSNGQDYAQIALVKAEPGNNNPYQLIDNGMSAGVNYYRIKLTKFGSEPVQIGNVAALNIIDNLSEARK